MGSLLSRALKPHRGGAWKSMIACGPAGSSVWWLFSREFGEKAPRAHLLVCVSLICALDSLTVKVGTGNMRLWYGACGGRRVLTTRTLERSMTIFHGTPRAPSRRIVTVHARAQKGLPHRDFEFYLCTTTVLGPLTPLCVLQDSVHLDCDDTPKFPTWLCNAQHASSVALIEIPNLITAV